MHATGVELAAAGGHGVEEVLNNGEEGEARDTRPSNGTWRSKSIYLRVMDLWILDKSSGTYLTYAPKFLSPVDYILGILSPFFAV